VKSWYEIVSHALDYIRFFLWNGYFWKS